MHAANMESAMYYAVAGALAGVSATFYTCPLDVVKTRLQNQIHSDYQPALGNSQPYRGTFGKGSFILTRCHPFIHLLYVLSCDGDGGDDGDSYLASNMEGRRIARVVPWTRSNLVWLPAHLGHLFLKLQSIQRHALAIHW